MGIDAEEKGQAYASRKFNVNDKKYPFHDLELSTVLFPLKIQKHYLCSEHFEVCTDHRSLQYLFNNRDINFK